MMTPAVELRRVQKSFGNTSVIRNVNLTIMKVRKRYCSRYYSGDSVNVSASDLGDSDGEGFEPSVIHKLISPSLAKSL
jgi:hypothetical protein